MRDGLVVRRAAQGLHWLLVGLTAFSAALAVRSAVAFFLEPSVVELPPSQPADRRQIARPHRQVDAGVILRRNLFGSESIAASEVPQPGAAPAELRLRGTATIDGVGYAVIEDPARGVQDVFAVGERIFDGPRLASVEEGRAVLLYRGRKRTIELWHEPEEGEGAGAATQQGAPAGGIRQTGKGEYLVDHREVEHALANLNTVVTQMRAVPYLRDGKSLGFRVFNIHPGSIFDRMGLRNGDVIQRVNGTELSSPANAMGLLDQLADASEIRIELMRNNKPQVFHYRIQ